MNLDSKNQFDSFYVNDVLPLTLEEAMKRFYQKNDYFTPYWNLKSSRAQALLRAHDTSHIVFGCGTNGTGEMKTQYWTLYGVEIDVSVSEKLLYFLQPEGLKLVFNRYAFDALLWRREEAKLIKQEVRKLSLRMRKKWRYFDEAKYANIPVSEIREEFGISVF